MIIRRVALTLVLVLFASVTIGVILGLDDTARSDLVSRLPRSGAPTVTTPEGTTERMTPAPPVTTTHATPGVTARARPTSPARLRVTASPQPQPTQKPTV